MAPKVRPVLVLIAGFFIHFTLGIGPTFGNILPYLVSYVRADSKPSELRYTNAAYVYSCQLAAWGGSTLIGGLLERRLGPRIVVLIGAVLMSFGSFASYFALSVNYWILIATFGFFFGAGGGISFICPLACAMKWYPKWKGLATGIISCGFASGGVLVPFAQTFLINPRNEKPNLIPDPEKPEEKYFTQRDLLDRVPYVFIMIGGICTLLQLVGLLLLKDPPSNIEPVSPPTQTDYESVTDDQQSLIKSAINEDPSDIEPTSKQSNKEDKISFVQVLRSPMFYVLLFVFFAAATTRAFIRALYKAFGLEEVADDDLFMMTVLVTGSIGSLVGRVPWGILADVTSFKTALVLQAALMTCLIATLYATSAVYKVMYLFWMVGINFCIGGYLTIFPVAIAQVFGRDNVGLVFGMVFIGQVFGSVLASFLSHMLVDVIHWYGVFFILTGFNIVSYILVLFIPVQRYMNKSTRT